MRVVFTTVVRYAPVTTGGWARVFEWPSGRLLAERTVSPVDPPVVDPNPRGNSRGGRGVVIVGDMTVIATYHTLEVCDRDLRVRGTFSHGNFAGIHEIMRRGERLFVASTAINAAAEVSLEAVVGSAAFAGKPVVAAAVRFWWPTEDRSVCQQLGVPITSYPDKEGDNRLRHLDLHNRGRAGHLHLDAVDTDGDHAYALLNKPGAIPRLGDSGAMDVVLRHPLLEGAHNLVFIGPGRAWVVGTSPAAILGFDRRTFAYRGVVRFSENVREIVHGIAIAS